MSIEVRGITKLFGSYTAVDNVNLKVADGELVALLDEGIARADLAGVWARWLGALAYPL